MKHTLAAIAILAFAAQAEAGALTGVDLDGHGGYDAFLESTTQTLWYREADAARGAMRFSTANAWAQSQTFAGFDDWRLPTLTELQSLYATLLFLHEPPGTVGDPMPDGPFDLVSPGQYWSTTASGVNVYGFDTRTGFTVTHVDGGASLYAWAVRAPTAAVPEPSSAALLATCLLFAFLARRSGAAPSLSSRNPRGNQTESEQC